MCSFLITWNISNQTNTRHCQKSIKTGLEASTELHKKSRPFLNPMYMLEDGIIFWKTVSIWIGMKEGYCQMKQWSGLHKIQQLAHLQGIVRPCQGTVPRLPGPAIAVLSVKTPFISQLLPCADKAAVVSTGPILVRLRVVTSGEFTCHELLLAHVLRAPVPMPFCFP